MSSIIYYCTNDAIKNKNLNFDIVIVWDVNQKESLEYILIKVISKRIYSVFDHS